MNDGSTIVVILCAAGLVVAGWRCRAAETRRRWNESAGRPLHIRIRR